MYSFIFIILATFAITFINSTSLKQPSISSTCGGTLSENTGGISYKPYEIFGNFERCIWTIQAPSTDHYTLNFYNLGDASSIVIAGYTLDKPLYQLESITANTDIVVSGNVIVVTFIYLSNSSHRGFSLYYTSTANSTSAVSTNSISKVITGENARIIHPQESHKYSNNELSTIALAPVYKSQKQVVLNYLQLGWDGTNCNDSITLYGINYEKTWTELGRICGADKEMSVGVGSNYILLLVFKTDATTVGRGFTIDYSYQY